MRRRSLPWVVVAWILLASFSTTQAAQSMTDETILNSGATFASRMRPSYLSASALIRQFYLEHCTGRGESGDIYEHLPMLRQLATQVDHITEMGSGVVATWAFLDGLVARQYAGYEALQIVGVDGHNHDNIDAVAEEAGIGYQIRPEDHTNFDIEPTDLLFIDPLQVDNHVKYQLAQHADRTRRFIVVHDTTVDSVVTATIQQGWGAENHSKESGSPGEIRHGLWPVVEEFLTEHSDTWMLRKRFTHNNGLTILERIQGQDCQCPARQFDTTSTKRREGKEGWDLKQPVLPVFYLSRDRSEWLRQSIESLRRIVLSPLEIIVFDNGSRYLPALEFLKELEAQGTKVHRSAQNLGRESMYAAVNQIKETWFEENKQRALSFYVVADPAITFPEGTRPDILEVFQHVLESHPEVTAVGPWQIKDDIPKFYEGSWFTALEQIEFNVRQNADVRDMRGQSVDARLCPLADFVMFRKAHLYAGGPVVGLAFERPFAARHLDYYIDPNNRTEEQQYHYEHANPTAHHGSKHYLEAMKAKRWFGDFPSVDDRNRVWTQALEFANLRKLDSALQLFDALRKGFPLQAKRYNDAAVTEMKLGRWFDALVSLSQGLHVAQQSTGAPHLTLLCENMHTFLANTFHRKDSDAQWHRKVVMEKLKDCPLKDSQPLQMPAVVETAPASPTNDTFLPAEHTSHLAVLRGGVQRVWIVHRGAWSHKQIARALATAAWKAGFKDVQIAYGSSPFDAVHAFAREAAVRQAHSAPEERMTVVVLGILDPEVFPTRSFRASMGYSLAVYQTEQPGGMGPVIDTFPFVDEVWDFAPSHVASWNRNSSVPNASRIMFLSFSPRQFAPDIDLSTQLHALDAAATTDVLFVGSGVWRRAAVRNALEAALPGKRVDFRIMQGQQIYDEDLDKAVDEARVVLNVHYHVDAALEDHRIAHMASRGACIVSETSHDPGLDHEWRGAIEFAQEAGEHGEDHGALVGTVQRLLFGPAARRVELRKAALERERKRFAWMVSRMEAARKDSVRK